jgi:chromosome segregation ATPase
VQEPVRLGDCHRPERTVSVQARVERVLASIERSRALLARSAQRLDRQEAGLRRAANHGERRQAEIKRESAETERRLVSALPDRSKAVDRAKETRTRARNAVEAFAAAQEEIARINEQLPIFNVEGYVGV